MVFKDTTDEEWTNREVPKLMRGVASKCTFCAHRLVDGRRTADVWRIVRNQALDIR